MKSFGGLFQSIVDPEHLERAMWKAARGKLNQGSVKHFLGNAERELRQLHKELLEGAYCPRPYLQFRILDPKPRVISCADFRDRVVHHAVCAVIAPLIERRLISDNYACRKGLGSHRAILRAQYFSRQQHYYLKTDIRQYYHTIDHQVLLSKLAAIFREEKVRDLFHIIIRYPVPGCMPGKGLPIGNLTSQWFANLYLDEIDHWVKETWQLKGYIRYMDDLACWDDSKERLFSLAAHLESRLTDELRIHLKSERTIVAPCSEGMPFLGWRVYPHLLRRQKKRLKRQRNLAKRREMQYMRGEIAAEKLQDCIRALNGLRIFFGIGEPVLSAVEI